MTTFFKFVGLVVWLGLIGCVAGLLGCASTQSARQQAKLYLEIGTNYLHAGQKTKALQALLKSADLNQKSSRVHDQLGVLYFLLNQHDKALQHSTRAVQLDVANTDARFNLGRIYVERSEYTKALKHLNLAAKDLTYNQQHKVWLNIGLAYFYQAERHKQVSKRHEQYGRALQALNKAHTYRPNCINTNWQARALFALKRYKLSLEAYDKAEPLCGSLGKAEAQYWKGMNYYRLRRTAEAKLQFGAAVRTAPRSRFAKRAARRLESIRN